MLIYCLTSSFPRDAADVAGRFVRQQCELLEGAGHRVRVFTLRGSVTEQDGLPVTPVNWLPDELTVFAGDGAPGAVERNPLRKLEAPLSVASLTLAALRAPAPDLYLGHWMLPGGLAARVASQWSGVPAAVVGHSAGIHALASLPPLLRMPLTNYIGEPASTSVPTAALAARLGVDGVRVLPMGFQPIEASSSRDASALVAMGRLVEVKGFDLAIRVAAALGRRLILLGDGPQRGALRQLADRLGAPVEFWGWADDAAKQAAVEVSSVALFPSLQLPNGRHEGWPVSVMEMAAAGVAPVLASWPGAAEMVAQPRLQVVGDRSVDRWASAVDRAGEWGVREASRDFAHKKTWAALCGAHVEFVEAAASAR